MRIIFPFGEEESMREFCALACERIVERTDPVTNTRKTVVLNSITLSIPNEQDKGQPRN